MLVRFLILGLFLTPFLSLAQKERGKVVRAPKIFQKNKSQEPEKVDERNFNNSFENEADFIFEEEPKLRFINQFEPKESKVTVPSNVEGEKAFSNSVIRIEPIREVNETVQDDTSSIDEGELMIIEIEQQAQFPGSDEMVKIASYFSIWDTRNVNPYGINPREFDEVVPIKLYDLTQGRYWASPLDACPLTSHFGWRSRRWHLGTDIDLETGDPVYSAFDGIVRISGTHSGWGRTVVVRHYNGLETLYGHLSKINFEENTIVKAGDEIGKGGNTGRSSGSHLHFETRFEGNAFDAENIFTFSRNKTEIRSQELVMTSKFWNYLRGGSSKIVIDLEDEDDFDEEEEVPTKIVETQWYRVRKGDNLTRIASNYGTTVSELCKLNRISAYKKLFVGMRLRVK
ncbi:Murein DD-endopeptidase MepM and murein hydrolase activator NlpD, contain LysM domain [Spirosomataceae bacterium TFI 002]|nr:Murein DD-endopeptidase MepM and murein hydrolase activator NlpD, contain LysM domain [Spirosomataceae bacterium TFI 002]